MLPGTAQYRVWVGGVGQRLVGGRKACGRIMEERNGGGGPHTSRMGRQDHPGRGKRTKMEAWRTAARPAQCVEPGD